MFDALDSTGIEPGANGVRILSASQHGAAVQLRVEGDELFATEIAAAPEDSHITYSGQALVGTTILVTAHGPDGDILHELEIVHVSDGRKTETLQFWAFRPDDPEARDELVPFYDITTRRLDDSCPPVHICKQNVADPIWTPVEHSALVFEGDHYDSLHDVTDVAAPTTWFNLACAGTAAAKMHLLRHTNAGAYVHEELRYHTTLDERDAMLRMLTADYCGDGASFTVDGQPLRYADSNHWYRYPDMPAIDAGGTLSPPGSSIEALWIQTGAICLDTPRRAAAAMMPVSKADVDAYCVSVGRAPLPPCTDTEGKLNAGLRPWEDHALVISANPPDLANPPLPPGAGAP